jgi:hypothetical protein
MTRKSPAKVAKADPDKVLQIAAEPGEAEGARLAKLGLDPAANAMTTARLFTKGTFGELPLTALYEEMGKQVAAAKNGDLSRQRAMLASQSIALNSIFTEMARRAALNMGEYIEASERYMRLALKAQAQSRATVEALEQLVGGREQTVKHVHVDNRGGQAVIADTVHTGEEDCFKVTNNPMQPERLAQAPRCLARTRSGTECQSPAVSGKRRCRMHGGANSGPPAGNRNAWKHGGRSADTIAAARWLRRVAKLVADGGA